MLGALGRQFGAINTRPIDAFAQVMLDKADGKIKPRDLTARLEAASHIKNYSKMRTLDLTNEIKNFFTVAYAGNYSFRA